MPFGKAKDITVEGICDRYPTLFRPTLEEAKKALIVTSSQDSVNIAFDWLHMGDISLPAEYALVLRDKLTLALFGTNEYSGFKILE